MEYDSFAGRADMMKQAAAQQGAIGLNVAKALPRSAAVLSRLQVLNNQLHELRGMTFAATENILGSEPSGTVGGPLRGGDEKPSCFMSSVESMIGELETCIATTRDELGRLIRAFQ